MPKDIPFHQLSKKTKRKRIEAEVEESNSTSSLSNNNDDQSRNQQLRTFDNSHIESQDLFNDQSLQNLLSDNSELSQISNHSDHSEHPILSEPSAFSESEYWDNDSIEDVILRENVDLDLTQHSHSSSNSSDSSQIGKNSIPSTLKILTFLRGWALKHNVTHEAVSALLAGLKENHECFADDESKDFKFPVTARTLLKTQLKLIKKVVEPGYYIHIGLKKQLLKLAPKFLRNISTFKLLVNIDGLPLFKSSPAQVYPILCTVVSIPELRKKVFPIGIYYGKQKPDDLNKYLEDFINEINILIEHGLYFDNCTIFLDGTYFVCDAPAKSYIMGTISHTGFHSCTRCIVRGITFDNRRVFLDLDSPPRTCEDFLEWRDRNFRLRATPLTNIASLDFVSHFILDYMHLECLGVMRTLISNIWYQGPIPHRLSATQIKTLSDHLVELRCYIPIEFARKCREIYTVLRWKATEFRLFMLYVGPIVLKTILSKQKYIHFIEFHCAMRILLNPNLCRERELRQFAKDLLKHFVRSTEILYAKNFIAHNFHNTAHIADDADYFADKLINFSLDTISAFPFENYMQHIKQKVRGHNRPLEQIGRRIGEIMMFESDYDKETSRNHEFPQLFSPHNRGPTLPGCRRQYRGAALPLFKIKNKIPDNCCGTADGSIIQVENVAFLDHLNIPVVIGREFVSKCNLYNVPIESSRLGVFKVKELSDLKSWPLSQITTKYMKLPYKSINIALSILHCDTL